MINMNISEEGISLIKNYEGCKLEAYQDSVGVWTIGYGHTKDVKDGDKINQDEAEHLLQEEMPEYEGYINDMVKVNIFLQDLSNFATVNEVMSQYFEQPYPARAAVQVARLPKDVAIEIDGVMELPNVN